jgi:hypothetical protein
MHSLLMLFMFVAGSASQRNLPIKLQQQDPFLCANCHGTIDPVNAAPRAQHKHKRQVLHVTR